MLGIILPKEILVPADNIQMFPNNTPQVFTYKGQLNTLFSLQPIIHSETIIYSIQSQSLNL